MMVDHGSAMRPALVLGGVIQLSVCFGNVVTQVQDDNRRAFVCGLDDYVLSGFELSQSLTFTMGEVVMWPGVVFAKKHVSFIRMYECFKSWVALEGPFCLELEFPVLEPQCVILFEFQGTCWLVLRPIFRLMTVEVVSEAKFAVEQSRSSMTSNNSLRWAKAQTPIQ